MTTGNSGIGGRGGAPIPAVRGGAGQTVTVEANAQQEIALQQVATVEVHDIVQRESATAARARTAAQAGPGQTNAGMTDDDVAVSTVYVSQGLASPYNSATTQLLRNQLQNNPNYDGAVSALNSYFAAHPTASEEEVRAVFSAALNGQPLPANVPGAVHGGEFIRRINALQAEFPGGNIHEMLFLVFRESIQATNEDKRYFLRKLQDYNKMAETLSDYLSELVGESQRLSAAAAGAKYPEKVTISITVKSFDLSTLDKDGKAIMKAGFPATKTVDRSGLNDTIKDVESMQETIRNKRQMASTSFQNFDQKANQLYNLMSSVLKVMGEMRSGITRNML